MTCTMILIKVKKSCASRRPHSLVQAPSGSSSRTMSRRLEMESDAVDDHQCLRCHTVLSVHSTMRCCITPSSPFHRKSSSAHSAAIQTSHARAGMPKTNRPRDLAPLTWFSPPVEAVYRGVAAARATASWSHR